MFIKNEKGVALIISLLIVMVLIVLGSIFILRTVVEKNLSDRHRISTQAFYLAEAGGHDGLDQLDTLINTYMLNTVNGTNPQVIANGAASYVAAGDGLGFLISYVKDAGVAQFTLNGSNAEFNKTAVSLGKGSYQYKIIVTEKSNPVAVSIDQWDFPYYYRIEAVGNVGSVSREIAFIGDFTVRVQRDNFAKYALFTNHHRLPNGTLVWFTDKTNFAGPVHTNERFNIALNPSGTFENIVTQQYSTARFYNQGSPILMDAENNPPFDVPMFHDAFNRGVDEIDLDSSVVQQDLIDEAKGTETSTSNGIYVPNNGSSLTGGVYIIGDGSIGMSVDASDRAVYTVTQGATTKIITVDSVNNQTTVNTVGVGVETFSGLPDGVSNLGTIIYADGTISSLGGTVQKDTEITIASTDDIIITEHVLYSDYTPAVGSPGQAGYVPPHAHGTTNLLGLVSWAGDVRIATSAPDQVDIHSTIMARDGIFAVTNYNDTGVGPRGTATLLGGVVTDYYGAFGLFNASTGNQISGYGRNFVYDERMAVGKAPPYYPSMRTFIAFTNDITDKIAWQEGGL